MTNWGQRLVEAREISRLSLRAFGGRVGLSHEAIRKFENEDREPKVSVALQVATNLGLTVDDMVGEDPILEIAFADRVHPIYVERLDTLWGSCIDTLALEVNGRGRLAALVLVSKSTLQAWVRTDPVEPTVAVAVAVAKRCGLPLQSMLTVGIVDPTAVVEHLRGLP